MTTSGRRCGPRSTLASPAPGSLTAEELEVVFSDFTSMRVPEDYREAVRERFAELS